MKFFIVDVFAEKKYQGNQLAVFVRDGDLSIDEMQQIANEMHFSESTFVTQATGDEFEVRIFTPDMEVPFAGHPTLGSAFVIRELLGWSRGDRLVLNLGVGQIPVVFSNGTLMMEQKQPSFSVIIADRSRIAEMLSIEVADLMPNFPVQVISTGLPSVIIPLKSMEAVSRCVIRHDRYQRFIDDTVKAALLVFAPETIKAENDLHVRVFVDDYGFFEDPATGSANGNLAAYLLEHRYFGKAALTYRVEQGYEMGRPSLLEVAAEKINSDFVIRVGGRVYPVAEGRWG